MSSADDTLPILEELCEEELSEETEKEGQVEENSNGQHKTDVQEDREEVTSPAEKILQSSSDNVSVLDESLTKESNPINNDEEEHFAKEETNDKTDVQEEKNISSSEKMLHSPSDNVPFLVESSGLEPNTDSYKEETRHEEKKKMKEEFSSFQTNDKTEKDIRKENTTLDVLYSEKSNLPEVSVQPTVSKRKLIIEPGIFLIMLGLSAMMTTTQNLTVFKLCHNQFGYDKDFCLKNMTNNTDVTNEVQKLAADYSLYGSLIETIPSIACSIFLGSWSDKHGRKFPLVLAATGYLLSAITTTIVGSIDSAPAYFLLFSSAITALTGGMASFFMAAFSMITDVTPPEKRSLRMAIVDAFLFGGMPVGMVISGALYGKYGFQPIFYTSCILSFLGLLYIIFFVKETIVKPSGENCRNICVDLFDITNFKNSLIVCFKKRKGKNRTYIFLWILCITFLIMPFMGESACSFLYMQKRFHWTQTDYSYYSASKTIIAIIGMCIAMPIVTKVLKLPDQLMALIGSSSRLINSVLIPLVTVSWGLYAVNIFETLSPLCLPVVRSQLSKLVEPGESGKVFSVISALESSLPLVAKALYTQLYAETLNTYIGSIYFLSAGFIGIAVLIFIYLNIDMRKTKSYKQLIEEKDEENSVPSGSSTNESINISKY